MFMNKEEKMVSEYISIILFAGDDIQCLERCLCHILDYTVAGQCELIIVEKTHNIAMHEYLCHLPNIRLIDYDKNRTAGMQCALAAQAATGEKILFMQDIVWVQENWLSHICSMLERHPSAGVVQVLERSEICDESFTYQESLKITGGCFLIDRLILQSMGGLLPDYETMNYCFFDLSARLWTRGKKIITISNKTFGFTDFVRLESSMQQVELDCLTYKNLNGFSLGYSSAVRDDLLSIIDYKRSRVKILEIGCACGGTLLRIKNNNPSAELYGIEICEPAAEIAKNFAEVLTADLESLERLDFIAKFDYIVMGDVLEHLFDTDAVLQKVHSWLNQTGKLVVSVPNISHVSVVMSLLSGQWEYDDSGILDRTHIRFFTMDSIKYYLQKNGFQIDLLGSRVAKVDHQLASIFEAFQEELLQLKTVCVKKENLKPFQIVCVASKG